MIYFVGLNTLFFIVLSVFHWVQVHLSGIKVYALHRWIFFMNKTSYVASFQRMSKLPSCLSGVMDLLYKQ